MVVYANDIQKSTTRDNLVALLIHPAYIISSAELRVDIPEGKKLFLLTCEGTRYTVFAMIQVKPLAINIGSFKRFLGAVLKKTDKL